MPRKRKTQPDNYNKAFPSAMRTLMEQKETTQNELADCLQKTRQSVSYYCDGSSSPDWETLVKIADYFDVSTDYLLGRTTDPDRTPSAMDELGLSEGSLMNLQRCNRHGWIGTINLLLGNERFMHLVAQISHFILNVSHNTTLSKQHQENCLDVSDKPSDYYKVQYVLAEERIMLDLREQIASQIPEIADNFSIHVGSYFVENEKRSIEDSFSEILRQISKYEDFRSNFLRLDDFCKER